MRCERGIHATSWHQITLWIAYHLAMAYDYSQNHMLILWSLQTNSRNLSWSIYLTEVNFLPQRGDPHGQRPQEHRGPPLRLQLHAAGHVPPSVQVRVILVIINHASDMSPFELQTASGVVWQQEELRTMRYQLADYKAENHINYVCQNSYRALHEFLNPCDVTSSLYCPNLSPTQAYCITVQYYKW